MTQAMISAADRQLFAAAASEIDTTFDSVIGAAERVAILHYPYDGNVGNHMMYLAIAEYLRRRRIPIAYAAHSGNFDVGTMRAAVGADPILFLGGVTVSRLWPDHAATKRLVAREFPHNRLVSLTSTMLFVDADDAADAAGMFGDHSDVVLLAREPESAAQARAAFGDQAQVIVVHDSSMRLSPITVRDRSPRHDILWLHRDDVEGTGHHHPTGVHVFDWPALSDPMYRSAYVRMRACGAVSRIRNARRERTPAAANHVMASLYHQVSRAIVRSGAEFVASGRVLVTDRMHPHILGALIGQPVVLLPDRFGKSRAIYEHSTAALSMVHWADDPDEAYAIARDLAALA